MSCPACFTHTKDTHCPLYRWLHGPPGQSGHVQKTSPPPGFDPQMVQPIASHYNNYTTVACYYLVHHKINFHNHEHLKY
jgi:hypothetical protein